MHLIIMASSFITALKPSVLLLAVTAAGKIQLPGSTKSLSGSFSIHLPQSFPSALCHYKVLPSKLWTKQFLLVAEVKF